MTYMTIQELVQAYTDVQLLPEHEREIQYRWLRNVRVVPTCSKVKVIA